MPNRQSPYHLARANKFLQVVLEMQFVPVPSLSILPNPYLQGIIPIFFYLFHKYHSDLLIMQPIEKDLCLHKTKDEYKQAQIQGNQKHSSAPVRMLVREDCFHNQK